MEAARGVGMQNPQRQTLLDEVVRVIELARPVVAAISSRDRELGSQMRRALSSVGLNLAEGFGSAAGNARLRFECARGSVYETRAGIRIAVAWGHVSAERAAAAVEALHTLGGRVHGLARR